MATGIDSTTSLIAPDIAAQQVMLGRRQQMADLLRQQSLTPDQGQMIGAQYIAPSWTQGLAKMAQALMAGKSQDSIDAQSLDLAKQYQGRLADMINGPQQAQQFQPAPQMAALDNGAQMAGPLGSGTALLDSIPGQSLSPNPMGQVTPATPIAASQPHIASVAPTPNGINLANTLRAMALHSLSPEMATAFSDQFKKSPDAIRAAELGVDQATQLANYLAAQKKAGFIPNTRLAEGAYAGPDNVVHFLPTTAPAGFVNQADPSNPSGYKTVEVGGGTAAVTQSGAASAKAKTFGEAAPQEYDPNTGKALPAGKSMAEFLGYNTPPAQAGGPQWSGSNSLEPAAKAALLQKVASGDPEAIQAWAAFNQRSPQHGTIVPPLGAAASANESQVGAPKAMNDSYSALQKARAGGSAALQDIDHMLELGSKKSPFVAGDYATGVAKIFSPNAAEYEKSRDNLVTQLSGQLGMSTDSAREMVYGSIPAYGAPKQAINNGLSNLRNQVAQRLLKADYLTPSFNSGNASDYTTKENQFDLNIKPSVVPLLQMPAGAARSKALSEAAKDPQTRASLEWAAQNGLLK